MTPWKPPSGKQHPPKAGAHGQEKATKHGGDQGGPQFVHPSLKGEARPDKPGAR